ncbi:substrate-binding domain-containing protein [Ascidiimonas sp. W6]|uniref:substrate-binding domain-containing protein n=1 Tax=Ascidiimonas meishanensis TaxID=3128903 RepID=UPI0030EC6064
MIKVRIAGVPEHFNLPWHMAIEEGAFHERGIQLEWTEVPEGTGRMCTMLRNNETDLAIILTEGIVKDIAAGNPSKIIQTYVESPLIWGVHVAANSDFQTISDLENSKAAISRFGSGSHLMSYVNASSQGWNLDQLKFEIVNNLQGGIDALTNGAADYFLWERFTTKPLVDNGIFRRVGDCPTPWPCFVIAISDAFLENHSSIAKHILEIINNYTKDFKQIPSIDRTIANRYEQKLEDVKTWLSLTKWGQSQLPEATLEVVQNQLINLNLLEKKENSRKILMALP